MIDWKQLWQLYAPNFDGTYAHIPVAEGKTFPLLPGGGFGDLSHPTTKLMLSLMEPYVKGKVVVDIGTGSGILAIAAKWYGAKEVYAFEIDEEAIEHAKKNFTLNKMGICINKTPKKFDTLLINMISSEQKAALAQYPFLKESPHHAIASGFLASEEESLASLIPPSSILFKQELQGWLAFVTYASPIQ